MNLKIGDNVTNIQAKINMHRSSMYKYLNCPEARMMYESVLREISEYNSQYYISKERISKCFKSRDELKDKLKQEQKKVRAYKQLINGLGLSKLNIK